VKSIKQIDIQYYKTKVGELILGSFNGNLCMVDYRDREKRKTIDHRVVKGLGAEFREQDSAVLVKTRDQLNEYFRGYRKVFEISLLMVGTDFQRQVWEALLKVPYGTTVSYLQLAKDIGNEKAVRAVANANGANAIGIIIPCHRIIGSNGYLGGYAGGVLAKKRLLKLEKSL